MAKKSATRKKKAASPKAKVNKSAKIRAYVAKHPKKGNTAVASALRKSGLDVTPQYVGTVKANAKKQGSAKTSKVSRPASKKARPRKSSDLVSMGSLKQAKDLVSEAGGVSEAKAAIDALAKLID
jgi:hypothetical protein